jgi:hypothetical protein
VNKEENNIKKYKKGRNEKWKEIIRMKNSVEWENKEGSFYLFMFMDIWGEYRHRIRVRKLNFDFPTLYLP